MSRALVAYVLLGSATTAQAQFSFGIGSMAIRRKRALLKKMRGELDAPTCSQRLASEELEAKWTCDQRVQREADMCASREERAVADAVEMRRALQAGSSYSFSYSYDLLDAAVPTPPPTYPAGSVCTDGDADSTGDTFNEGCAVFYITETRCTNLNPAAIDYDDDDFTASDMCCTCGGGTNGFPPTAVPIPAPTPQGTCFDSDVQVGSTGDTYNEGCAVFYTTETRCTNLNPSATDYDDDDFTASDMCCTCGGGNWGSAPTSLPTSAPSAAPIPAPTVLPTVSPYPTPMPTPLPTISHSPTVTHVPTVTPVPTNFFNYTYKANFEGEWHDFDILFPIVIALFNGTLLLLCGLGSLFFGPIVEKSVTTVQAFIANGYQAVIMQIPLLENSNYMAWCVPSRVAGPGGMRARARSRARGRRPFATLVVARLSRSLTRARALRQV